MSIFIPFLEFDQPAGKFYIFQGLTPGSRNSGRAQDGKHEYWPQDFGKVPAFPVPVHSAAARGACESRAFDCNETVA